MVYITVFIYTIFVLLFVWEVRSCLLTIQSRENKWTKLCLYPQVHELICIEKLPQDSRSRVHERTIPLRFLGIILRLLRLEVRFPYTMFKLQNSIKPIFPGWGGGGGGVRSMNSKEGKLHTSKNSASGMQNATFELFFVLKSWPRRKLDKERVKVASFIDQLQHRMKNKIGEIFLQSSRGRVYGCTVP